MTRDWRVVCKDCGKEFAYSDSSAREAAARGESRPERCRECRQTHNRQTARMGAAYIDLDPGSRPALAGMLKAGRLGRVDRGARPHRPDAQAVPQVDAGTFGITDKHIGDLLTLMESNQVVVVNAPTGSGKSTFLPWRLLNPPAPYPQDTVTRHGVIVVTQPRIEATQGIPRFLASRLHGSSVGAGVDIGFRHSQARDQADSRNQLVFATDGTLLNMIRRGELFGCSTVIIDEAHERSLNIDLIVALMRRQLVMLPQLRLLIVSATIDTASFAGFFRPELDTDEICLPGKPDKPVFERWRAAEEIPHSQWAARMPGEVARTAMEVLRWLNGGDRPADIPADIPAYDGDILAFLPGRRAIDAAIDELTDLIDDDPLLRDTVDVLPLYAELPQRQRDRALKQPRRGAGKRKRRVIVSTNIAETSLTIDGVCHVIDSGLINSTEWDPSTLTTVVRPKPHSQSGLRQRRGRAGRTAPGVWHCLFTQAQFDALPFETPPEIVRAPLERVVLTAAAAGVSDPASLRWLPPGPPTDEMRRAMATLRGMGAIDNDGNPTVFGSELAVSTEAFDAAALLMCADEAGVAVEAATVLAAVRERRWVKALRWSNSWPAVTRLHADRVHAALLSDCVDDLDAVLLLIRLWEETTPQQRPALARRFLLSGDTLQAIVDARGKLLQSLQSRTKSVEVRGVEPALSDRLRRVIAWSAPNALYGSVDGTWQPTLVPRADPDVVARLHQGAQPELDTDTLLARNGRTPQFLATLARDRRRRWKSPFQDPADQVTLSFCVALDAGHLAGDVPLLAHVAGHGPARSAQPPAVLPGERILVEAVGTRADGTQVRVLARQTPLTVPDLELETVDEFLPDSGDLDQRERPGSELEGLEAEPANAADYLLEESLNDYPDDLLSEFNVSAADGDGDLHVNPFADLEVITTSFDPAQPVVAVTEVTGQVVRAEPDPVAAMTRFAEAFPLGSECTVVVDEVRVLNRDRSRVLLVREPRTGVRMPLSRIEIGFGVRYAMLDEHLVGGERRLAVAAVDADSGLVLLSALPWMVAALSRIAAGGIDPYQATIIDSAPEQVWLAIRPDGRRVRTDDPPIGVEVRSSYLPLRPQEMAIGQEVRVVPHQPGQRSAEAELDVDDFRIPNGPISRRGRTLTVEGPLTPRDILAMYTAGRHLSPTDQVELNRVLGLLVARALRPRLRIIDTTGLHDLSQRNRTPVTIVNTEPTRITVRTEGGYVSTINTAYLAWPGRPVPALSVGDEVEAFVGQVDVEQGRARLSLRNPVDDPMRQIDTDRLYEGTVVSSKPAGLQVACPQLPANAFIPASETLVPRAAPPIELDTEIIFRVINVEPERRQIIASRAVQQLERRLPGDLLRFLQGRDRIDGNRLRPLIGESPHVRIDGDRLLLRWTAEEPDVPLGAAQQAVDAVLSGQVTDIDVPFLGALTDPGFRDEIASRFAALIRHDRFGNQWRTSVLHPTWCSTDEIHAAVATQFPNRILATGLDCANRGQFVETQRAFKDAERARGKAGSRLSFQRPYNYVDIGPEDSWEAFAQRLASFGLTLAGPQYVAENRVTIVSTRWVAD